MSFSKLFKTSSATHRETGRRRTTGRVLCLALLVALSSAGCSHQAVHDALHADAASSASSASSALGASSAPFQIAMIPDTQNYTDYTHQEAEGFVFDASEMFIAQMDWIAARSRTNGGDIAFVASVGDVWQHQSEAMDPAHAARGAKRIENPLFAGHFDPTPKVLEVEIPKAIEGYERIAAAGMPFGVAPGNHDYDAMWNDARFPPNMDKPRNELTWSVEDIGMLHVGGLNNFRSAFGDDRPFFKDKSWYVASHHGGTSSAQIFVAGGYHFLHFALEMQAGDEVVAWVESVMAEYPGFPTILSTHDYLNPRGERGPNPIIDLARVDPEEHNDADALFRKLIVPNDQIFLVLCGHHHGQATRIDENAAGHAVIQMLADYQDRGQAGLDAGQPRDRLFRRPVGLGDGWFRLLEFDLASAEPKLNVRTYSTHYNALSSELGTYAEWYKAHEQPKMSDAEFLATEEFTISLDDFRERFGPPVLK
ncbi:MAG: serine/threonine protein phosphatase [Myxococcota bacterium]